MSERLFSLDQRLLCVANMLGDSRSVIDVGSDHAKLPVWLLKNNRINKAYATDISEYSVLKIERAVKKYGLEGKLFSRCGNGLDGFCGTEAETVIICGMGGETICKILKAAPWTFDGKHDIIIQCMSSFDVLNKFLAEGCLCVTDEQLVTENGRMYSVLKFRARAGHTNPAITVPSPYILKSDICEKYLQHKQLIVNKEIIALINSGNVHEARLAELTQYLDYYRSLQKLQTGLNTAVPAEKAQIT